MSKFKKGVNYLMGLLSEVYSFWKEIPFVKMFSSVSVVFVIAVLLLFLGALLGDKDTQVALQGSFPTLCLQDHGFSCFVVLPRAGLFLTLFFLFSVLFLGRELAIGQAVQAEKIEMLQAVSNAPSQKLLDKFVELYDDLEKAVKSKNQHADMEIAFALGGLITLVKSYQPSWTVRKKIYYCAEILMYRSISKIDEQQMPLVLSELNKFLYNQNNLGEVEGVLESIEGLAMEDVDGEIKKKEVYQRIVLPIPVQKTAPGNDKISRVLAGSAEAYQNTYYYINNTEVLRELYEDTNRYDFHPSLIRNEMLFFSGEGSKMKSIFSIRFGGSASATTPSGVITIYCDRQNLFINQSMVENFRALSRPIVHKVEELLEMQQH